MGLVSAASGHGWGPAVFPLIATVVALVFGVQLARRFVTRRRAHDGAWAVALFMYAAASGAMFAGVLWGWSAIEFRLYYLLGAVLNVPYLFLGEVYLLSPRTDLAHAVLAFLLAATTFAAWQIVTAPIRAPFLTDVLPLGREVFGGGSLPHRLAQYYAFPAYFLLLAGLVWSAMQLRDHPRLRRRAAGAMWIALGATVVAIGSGVGAGFHVVWLFSVSLAAGVAIMYWGFLEASRPLSD
jgi:hypothetical protein